MKKKISLLLAIVMAVSLFAGCGGQDDSAAKQPEDQTGAADAQKPDDTAQADAPQYDFSSFEKYTDATCPNGAVLYADIVDEINTVVVPNKPIRIGIVWKHFGTADGVTYKEAIEREVAALNEKGAQIEVSVEGGLNGNDKEGQLAVLRSMIAKKYDVIVVSPISDASLLPGIEEAIAAGIKLVTFQAPFDEPYIPYSVSFSFQAQGELAAEWCAKQLPDGGKVACIMGVADAASAINVTKGFEDWIKSHPESKLELVDVQDGSWDRVRGNEIMSSWLVQYPDLAAVFSENSAMAMGALEAIKDAGKLGEIKLLGRDGVEEEFESIRAGELDATISQMFDVAGVVNTQVALLAYNGVELPDRIWLNAVIVDKDNVDDDRTSLTGLKEVNYVIAQ